MELLTGFLLSLIMLTSTLAAQDSSRPNSSRVALVFDDGPSPEQNETLLRVLADAKVQVTFCYVGRAVEAHPALAQSAARAGHEINNHSFTHPHLLQLGDTEVISEISRASQAITQATGNAPSWFWAPYLESDERIERLVKQSTGLSHFPYRNYNFISSNDWDTAKTDAATIFRNATTGVKDQTIILFHEWRAETVAQMPAILQELRRQGCVFVTFTALAEKTSGPVAP